MLKNHHRNIAQIRDLENRLRWAIFIKVATSKTRENVSLFNSFLISLLIMLHSHNPGSSSRRPSITPGSRPSNQGVGTQSRCVRGREEEYPTKFTFDILCPGAHFVRDFVPLTFELIDLALVSQNSDLPDHDQRIRDLERECERSSIVISTAFFT